MSYCPGVLDKAQHKMGNWWVTSAPGMVVLIPSYHSLIIRSL